MAGNLQVSGEDSRPTVQPIFAYSIRHLDLDSAFFLCNWEEEIEIEGLPASWDADDPQAFTPSNVQHGQVERRDGIDKVTFDIEARLGGVSDLSRYALHGAIPKIRIDVIRISPGPILAGIPAVWGRDTLVVQSGLIDVFGIQGLVLKARCAPEPFLSGHQVPRWRFTRTCNRQLYSAGCGVDREDFKLEANIASLDVASRSLVVSDELAGESDDFFRQGVLVHVPTTTRNSVFTSQKIGDGTTRIWLHQWFPDFEVNDAVTIFAGCRHTLDDCATKFDNVANFGGFPGVPNENPGIHGVS